MERKTLEKIMSLFSSVMSYEDIILELNELSSEFLRSSEEKTKSDYLEKLKAISLLFLTKMYEADPANKDSSDLSPDLGKFKPNPQGS
jgi:Mg2+ and Co2+ transporter CorA